MALKGWVLHKVNRLFTRVDLPPRATPLGEVVIRRTNAKREPGLRVVGDPDAMPRPQDLGAYAPLVAAMREELEHFVASHVRMHLSIAEHDRFLLTSIEVECIPGDDSRELLQRFMREFKPGQIKHYIAKEVIGRLPNASAIDLAHFGGINAAATGGTGADAGEAYGELLAALRVSDPRTRQRPYQVTLKGRWSELDRTPGEAKEKPGFEVPRTPIAGRTLEVEIDDANGTRRFALTSVVPGRRYTVGNGEGCDIVVKGKYSSRRHCEIWLDKGAWWVTDIGSTNGIRVESAESILGRSGISIGNSAAQSTIEVVRGARIVLSGLARGEPALYPRLLLRTAAELDTPVTPLAPRVPAPTTPATPIVAARKRSSGMTLTVRMASGEKTLDLPAEPLPFCVGRSRSQALVIDWAHEDVSGHHVDIVEIGDGCAKVVVHGDNGVRVAGASHAPGTQFRWNIDEKMALGRAMGAEPECTLTLSRRP